MADTALGHLGHCENAMSKPSQIQKLIQIQLDSLMVDMVAW